ncbi:MAG: PH domain-containing protein [Dehalococcoidia bacterium]
MAVERFAIRRDWWLVWPGALFALVIAVGIWFFSDLLLLSWAVLALALWHLLRTFWTWYELRDSELVVVQGLVRRRYPYEQIARVHYMDPKRGPSSVAGGPRSRSAFLSYHGLVLEFSGGGGRGLTISPLEMDRFVEALKDRAGHVVIERRGGQDEG